MKRALAWIAVGALVLVGTAFLAGAAWFAVYIGADGVVASPLGRLTSTPDAKAVVIDIERVDLQGGLPGLGHVRFVAESADGSAVVLATGDAQAVADGLEGVAYDAASFTDGQWQLAAVPGGGTEPVWTKEAWPRLVTGHIAWLVVSPGMDVVLGQASGGPGVEADLRLEWRASTGPATGWWLAMAGAVLLLLATVGSWLIARRR